MAGSPRSSIGNVRFDMDITYPEHLSRLHRHSLLAEYPKHPACQKKTRNPRNRRGNRYRTQPVTFDEIQELDEDNNLAIDTQRSDDSCVQKAESLSTSKFELDFLQFSKALEAKCKKTSADSSPEGFPGSDVFTENKRVRPKFIKSSDDAIRRIDSDREGSI